jgi:hypothetical protein
LSEEERKKIEAKRIESLDSAGGKLLLAANCEWSSGQWQFFGLEEFPDAEAVHRYMAKQYEVGFRQHVETKLVLGTRWEEPS